ncbi:MAG: hypothetical protein IPH00_16870 [Flavobacteriales bacterium]|nr:hypothetical protein [Flavobacteriales bacterium]
MRLAVEQDRQANTAYDMALKNVTTAAKLHPSVPANCGNSLIAGGKSGGE